MDFVEIAKLFVTGTVVIHLALFVLDRAFGKGKKPPNAFTAKPSPSPPPRAKRRPRTGLSSRPPSREQLIAEIAGIVQEIYAGPVRTIGAIAERLEPETSEETAEETPWWRERSSLLS